MVGGGLQEGGGFLTMFPIHVHVYFFIFVQVYGGGLQEKGGLQERIQYMDMGVINVW